MTIYVNWETHDVKTPKQLYDKIEECANNFNSCLFEEWINGHYDASDIFKMRNSYIINEWREYVEGVFLEDYEEFELDE